MPYSNFCAHFPHIHRGPSIQGKMSLSVYNVGLEKGEVGGGKSSPSVQPLLQMGFRCTSREGYKYNLTEWTPIC